MVTIDFIQPDGSRINVNADGHPSVMHAAVKHGVEGIIGECGGELSCATCHVYLDKDTCERLPAMRQDEEELLEFTEGVTETSRLGCQIRINNDIDGATFEVANQGM